MPFKSLLHQAPTHLLPGVSWAKSTTQEARSSIILLTQNPKTEIQLSQQEQSSSVNKNTEWVE